MLVIVIATSSFFFTRRNPLKPDFDFEENVFGTGGANLKLSLNIPATCEGDVVKTVLRTWTKCHSEKPAKPVCLVLTSLAWNLKWNAVSI